VRFDPADEQRLLLDARLYDAEALALIFDTYYDSIFRYIYVRVGHEQVSEDLAAQVFQRLLAHLREGRGPEQFLKAWLFRVAENLIIDDARRGVYRTHAPLDGASEIAVTNNEGDPLVLGQLRAALDQLPPAQRQAVTLRYLLEFSNEEIAQVMNLSVGAVKAHVHRGLTTLRGKLSEKTHE
jgi:RNA polymerase sigma-70 factor (ECF subfamily)